jgi:hypothetical protein
VDTVSKPGRANSAELPTDAIEGTELRVGAGSIMGPDFGACDWRTGRAMRVGACHRECNAWSSQIGTFGGQEHVRLHSLRVGIPQNNVGDGSFPDPLRHATVPRLVLPPEAITVTQADKLVGQDAVECLAHKGATHPSLGKSTYPEIKSINGSISRLQARRKFGIRRHLAEIRVGTHPQSDPGLV